MYLFVTFYFDYIYFLLLLPLLLSLSLLRVLLLLLLFLLLVLYYIFKQAVLKLFCWVELSRVSWKQPPVLYKMGVSATAAYTLCFPYPTFVGLHWVYYCCLLDERLCKVNSSQDLSCNPFMTVYYRLSFNYFSRVELYWKSMALEQSQYKALPPDTSVICQNGKWN